MATKKPPVTGQKPMAYVEVGYSGYLVPLADGQRLVGILAGAVKAKQAYRGMNLVYEVEELADPVHAALTVVQPKQVVVAREEPLSAHTSGTRAIGHEPLKITGPAP